ncbi:hypothetical protein K2X05_02320 [bacterium]|nr:hypothetical protein [bacterium]
MSSFKIASPTKIENYQPEKVESPPSPQSLAFFDGAQDGPKDFFELNPEISHFIGLTAAKNKEEKRRFDAEVLKYVQKIKDNAFNEAYEQGLKQGIEEAKKDAFNSSKQEIGIHLRAFTDACEKINKISKNIFEQNEKDIIDLSYLIAEKIVHKQLQREPDFFLNIFKEVLKNQSATTIQISEEDYQFFENNKAKIELDIDLSQIKVDINKDLQSGDVLFFNDMGILDGTLTSRLEVLKQIVTGAELS